MAVVTNSYDSFEAIGNWTDISDVIYNVAPTETPFLSSCKKGKALNRVHQWQTDTLAAAAENHVGEGLTFAAEAQVPTVIVSNVTSISDKSPQVTGTQEATKHYGRGSETKYKVKQAMKELKRDVELKYMANLAKATGDSSSTAAKCAGLQNYILTNTSIAGDATASAGDGSTLHVDGAARALTESMFETVLASAWTEGGRPTKGFMGAFQKRKIAGFSGNSTPYHNKDSKTVYNSVDVYIDPLGCEIRMIPSRQCPTDVVYFIDPDYVEVANLRDFRVLPIPRQGDYTGNLVLCEGTIKVGQEKAHAGVYDLTTS